jgi:hypothetical protein
MLRSSRFFGFCVAAFVVVLTIACVGCGSSSKSNTLSSAQAQAVSQELSQAMQSALAGGLTPTSAENHASLPRIVQELASTQSGCTITNSGESCNIPITYQGNCPNGGTISVSGDLIFTLDSSGDGSDNSSLTITPSGCAVSNVTINGDPNVTVTSQFSFQNSVLAYPVTFSESGGISFGPNPSGSCTVNVNLTATSATACTVSGTICGHSVSGSC